MLQVNFDEKIIGIEKWIFRFLCGYALFSSISIAGGNVFLGLAVAAGLVRLYKKHDDWRELLTIDKALSGPFFLMVGVFLLVSIFSTDIVHSGNVLFNHYVNRLMPFLLVVMFVREKKQLIWLVFLAGASMLINNLSSIIQWHVIGGDYAKGHRTPGLIGTMMTAGFNSMWLPVLFLLGAKTEGKWKYCVWMAMLIAVIGTVYNNTRGAWLAIAITMAVTLFLFAKSKVKALVFLLVLALGVGVVVNNVEWMADRVTSIVNPTSNSSSNERLILWESARNMVADYPLTGVGYGGFEKNYQEKYILPEAHYRNLGHAHNNFYNVLAETGYPGAIALCIWWLGTVVYCLNGWRKKKNIAYLLMLAVFLGIMLQGVTEYTMGDSIVMKFFWFAMGSCVQWLRLTEE